MNICISRPALAFVFLAAACNGADDPAPAPTTAAAAVTPAETAAPLPTAVPTDSAIARETAFPTSFRALGTEPFWAVHVSEGRLRYMTPDDQQGQSLEYRREPSDPNDMVLTARLGEQDLVLSGRIEECSDGMSDHVYPYSVTLRIGDDTQNGCARTIEP